MEENRSKELRFLIRTKTPVPLVESRTGALFEDDLYDDIYTINELIEQEYLEYIGKDKNYQLFLRPLCDFEVFIVNEIWSLKSGEMVTLSLTKAGHTEFETWIQNNRNPLI